jgi:hypothetical protein
MQPFYIATTIPQIFLEFAVYVSHSYLVSRCFFWYTLAFLLITFTPMWPQEVLTQKIPMIQFTLGLMLHCQDCARQQESFHFHGVGSWDIKGTQDRPRDSWTLVDSSGSGRTFLGFSGCIAGSLSHSDCCISRQYPGNPWNVTSGSPVYCSHYEPSYPKPAGSPTLVWALRADGHDKRQSGYRRSPKGRPRDFLFPPQWVWHL